MISLYQPARKNADCGDNRMKVEIRVQPGSSKEEVVRLGRHSYKIYMHEKAREGKANRKLVRMLAEHFGTKKNKIVIETGLKTRNKIVEINL